MTVVIGVTIGALAGFYGGWVEEALMRITEFFQVLPTLLFSMVIVALFGASLPMITIAIGIVSWTAVARITRSEFLRDPRAGIRHGQRAPRAYRTCR